MADAWVRVKRGNHKTVFTLTDSTHFTGFLKKSKAPVSQLMDEGHYNILSLQQLIGKKPVHFVCVCGSTSFSGTPLGKLIFPVKLNH